MVRKKRKAGCISRLLGLFVWGILILVILGTSGKKDQNALNPTIQPKDTQTAIVAPSVTPVPYDEEDPLAVALHGADNDVFITKTYDLQPDVLMITAESVSGKMSYQPGMAVLYVCKTANAAFEASKAPMLYYVFREEGKNTITMRLTAETASFIDFEKFLTMYGHVDGSSVAVFLTGMDGYSLIGDYKPLLN